MRQELNGKWEIPRSEIQLGKKLGEGKFGEVYYGQWKNVEIAVKILKIGIMQQLQKVSLVQLYAVCSRDEPFWLIQEYISHGCLVNYLRTHERKQLQKCDLEYIAYQIALGMKYLEAKNYIHRDLDARNILIGKRNFTTIQQLLQHKNIFVSKVRCCM